MNFFETHDKHNIIPNSLINADCFDVMPYIKNNSVNCIFADLPYCSTDFKWDTLFDLKLLWQEYIRILNHNGVILLYATQPFASTLIQSNPKWFKYDWVWIKSQAANFQLAKKMPLKKHETILVFYNKKPTYNPQMWKGEMKGKRIGAEKYKDRNKEMFLKSKIPNLELVKNDIYYPTTILDFPSVSRNKSLHPTQKSLELTEYLLKTYTNENDLVLDNVAGSSTVAVACININRQWIMIEKEKKYYDISVERIKNHKPSLKKETEQTSFI